MESWSYVPEEKGYLFSDEMDFSLDAFMRSRRTLVEWDNKSNFERDGFNSDREVVKSMEFVDLGFPDLLQKSFHGSQPLETSSYELDSNSSKRGNSSTHVIALDSTMGEEESDSKHLSSLVEAKIHDSSLIDLKLGRLADCKGASSDKVTKEGFTLTSIHQTTLSKRARTSSLSAQAPVCQVYGCNMDLSSSKDYHKRHKVCDAHSKTAKVIVNGLEQRFCQQCSRFHVLAEFDDGKRSCRRRLAGHNERRRKPQFDYMTGKQHKILQSYQGTKGSHTIRTLAWNPTGQLIATGSADRTLRIWNPERPSPRYSTELRGHSAGIEKVLFNPVRDAELASCSTDGTVRFWDVRSKTCVSRLDVGGEAFTLSWSADGSTMVVGKKDDTLIPISIQSPSSPNIIGNESSGTGRSSYSVSKPGASTYTALTPHPQPVQTNATTFSHHVASPTSPDLHLFATTGDGTVKIMSYPSFDILHTLNAHTSACMAISLAPTGKYLAIGGSDALISLWDTKDWICQRTLSSENGGGIRGVSWSFDGRFLCGACDEQGCGGNGLEIFHAETGESVYTVPTTGANAGVPAVAWHPSRYWLAYSTTNDGPGSGGPGGLKIVGAGGGSV